jgi:hypothetical protein
MSTTTTPVTNINFSSTQPAPPAGQQNILWNDDGAGDISGFLPNFVGDSGTGGEAGSVPAPAAGAAQAGKFLKADGTWEIPAATGVTSVAVTAPASLLTVTGSPITSSGTVALALAAQGPNMILAGPVGGTASAVPTFRPLTAADLPAGISGTTVALETNGTANNNQAKLNLVGGANVTLSADTAGDVTVALNPTVNVTTVNTTSVSASGAVAAASFSASGDITTGTMHTGTATVTGALTVAGSGVALLSSSNTFTASQSVTGGVVVNPAQSSTQFGTASGGGYVALTNSGAATDQKIADFFNNGSGLLFRFVNDTNTNATNWLNVTRTGFTPTLATFAVPVTSTGTVSAANFAGQGAPTSAIGAATVVGTGASFAVFGSNSSGEVDFTVGSAPSAAGTIATITFSTPYPSAPKAVIVGNGTSVPPGLGWSTTATTITLTCSGALPAGSFYKLAYMLIA